MLSISVLNLVSKTSPLIIFLLYPKLEKEIFLKFIKGSLDLETDKSRFVNLSFFSKENIPLRYFNSEISKMALFFSRIIFDALKFS